ncbi:hypothetical protein Poly41_58240 [Novipirellula artificiosorum]|uniref:Uncharacterized protein n=1 Tax=Novipirellula artificiosorum TaxID=2528016 RepID=A0A5C6D9M8_9BACT|nr:hypothetical protein Poly41_58240 [Novipirellula artificiosorum]
MSAAIFFCIRRRSHNHGGPFRLSQKQTAHVGVVGFSRFSKDPARNRLKPTTPTNHPG